MSLWNELNYIKIKNKKYFENIFSNTITRVKNNKLKIIPGIKEYKNHYIITEENRLDSYFIHIVPKPAYYLFKALQKEPSFLGFTVMAGTYNNKPVRVSCFGIECSRLGKSLITKH